MKKEILEKLSENFLVPPIVNSYDSFKLYAVRSNDKEEDGEFTNAGKFHTELFVSGDKVEEVLASFKTDFFVQEMILPDYSFVYLKTPNDEIIQVNNGLCHGITSGELTGVFYMKSKGYQPFGSQEYAFEKNFKKVESKKPLWTKTDMHALRGISLEVGKFLGYDSFNIEASVLNNKIYILQARSVKTS